MLADGLIREAILLGEEENINGVIKSMHAPKKGISVLGIKSISRKPEFWEEYRKARNLSRLEHEIVETAMNNPVILASLMLKLGQVDCFIGGIRTNTAEVLSAGINIIKADRRVGVITSFCVIETENTSVGENGLFVIADPVVNPDPSVGVLCKIAEAASQFMKNFLHIDPRIAFLSYSTKGSGSGKSVEKMQIAAERAQMKMPEIIVDGEIQLDAAILPEIALKKDPLGRLKGRANVFIFPNLDSANIGSKILQYFGNAKLIGPIIFGLNKPFNDISRSATSDDVCNLSIITQLLI